MTFQKLILADDIFTYGYRIVQYVALRTVGVQYKYCIVVALFYGCPRPPPALNNNTMKII